MKCCICGEEIRVGPNGYDQGNNAAPVKDGRCCDHCNESIIIPARTGRRFKECQTRQ